MGGKGKSNEGRPTVASSAANSAAAAPTNGGAAHGPSTSVKRIARFPKKAPCVDVLAAALWVPGSDEAALKWVPKPDDHPPSLLWAGGGGADDELKGRTVLLRYFGRLAGLYPLGSSPQASGLVDHWVAVVKRGRILFEVNGIPEQLARETFHLAACKLPLRTRLVSRKDEATV